MSSTDTGSLSIDARIAAAIAEIMSVSGSANSTCPDAATVCEAFRDTYTAWSTHPAHRSDA
ncbi:hypothetical protein ACIBG0_08085 [Nocardia sp. NPDC050630]|uniref:hypothetical protein n=1 Tax=Nocardia sp. NPDC050630 TaxID=3364321 RepID=UPI0037A41BC5